MLPASRTDLPKRLFDLVMASCLLALFTPLLLLIGTVVRLQLGSPVLFRQRRPGLRGKPFSMCKFRTMCNETTDADGHELSSKARTPPLGRRLRALSLDELPELWNVLKGEMSLVGPRPLRMEYLPRYSPEQARRHEVRPGITGLAQVSGRNAITWEEKFARDVEYVDRRDMRMDIDILVRTISTVLLRRGIRHSAEVDMPEFTGTVRAAGPGAREDA